MSNIETNVTVAINGHEYTGSLEDGKVRIAKDGIWSGAAWFINGRIQDCAADLGEDVYDAIESALCRAVAA